MATKFNVPLFNESVDPTDPGSAGRSFIGMAGGAALALAAIGVGGWLINTVQDSTGVGSGLDIPVAGD